MNGSNQEVYYHNQRVRLSNLQRFLNLYIWQVTYLVCLIVSIHEIFFSSLGLS
jgi:hypothetical protein